MSQTRAIRRPPGEGERAARRGYVHQDRYSARLIHAALLDGSLKWVGLADRKAGKFDDLVLGLEAEVVGHQFKKSAAPAPIGLTQLLLGTNGEIAELAVSFMELRQQFPDDRIRLRYLDDSPPSTNDRLISNNNLSTTAAFLDEARRSFSRPLARWLLTAWAPVITKLHIASGLDEANFDAFWASLELVLGHDAAQAFDTNSDPYKTAEVEQIFERLPAIIEGDPDRDRWTREEILAALNWQIDAGRVHVFPILHHVQSNPATEARMANALAAEPSGYFALVGAPGSGKSTFLQREIRPTRQRRVIRSLAFVPGLAQGQGRGEADNFFDDVIRELTRAGLDRKRMRDPTTQLRQQEFEHLLAKAGERYRSDGIEFVLIIDGLDHVPREERPSHSFLAALPLPQAVPEGVKIVLGTQRLNDLGLPPQVEAQANHEHRRVDIAPLSLPAVTELADAMALPDSVDRLALFSSSKGHPLVTRYLIGLLNAAEPSARDAILDGRFAFDGDLEAIYEAAWRSAGDDAGGDAARRVLALLGWVEGEIEPQLLAQTMGEPAVEIAFKRAQHLLLVRAGRWSVFHNSFRLFLRRKRIEKFGQPDVDFEQNAVYRRLADVAQVAPVDSPQRWLEFRYSYLASDFERARALASRNYFVGQYVAGRPATAVRGDIRDAYRLYAELEEGVAGLFELMLADDEVSRRAQVMEGADSLVDAFLALGDYDAAVAALDDVHPAGKEWLVVDALLDAGFGDRARAVFDTHNPLHDISDLTPPLGRDSAERLREWIRRAVVFLDQAQLRRRLEQLFGADETDEKEREDRQLFRAGIDAQVASALIGEGVENDVDLVVASWRIEADDVLRLLIDAAAQIDPEGNPSQLISLLERSAQHPALAKVHKSWPLLAAKLALGVGATGLARSIAAQVPVVGFAAIDPPGRIEKAGSAAKALAGATVLHTRLGESVSPGTPPKERLLQASQAHILALGEAIGLARGGQALPVTEVERKIGRAMRFVALGRCEQGDDWALSHMIGSILDVIVELIFSLLALTPGSTYDPAAAHESLIAGESRGFGFRTDVRRQFALKQFLRESDKVIAVQRLEDALAGAEESDPRAQIEEHVQFAIAFAVIGDPDRARTILSRLRKQSLGTWLAAKKDGQYELWTTVLSNANRADPEKRKERAELAIRLVDGLMSTEGYDMAGRIARQVLYEAAAFDAPTAWSGARWAGDYGRIGWDGIVDSTLRGLVSRNSEMVAPALLTWVNLALPWYREPHGSTVTHGQFLTDMVRAASIGELAALQNIALQGIGRFAQPDIKLLLLRKLKSALVERGVDACLTDEALARWGGEDPREKSNLDERDYSGLSTLADVEQALIEEHRRAGDQPQSYTSVPGWSLRQRVREISAESAWHEVKAFNDRNPDMLKDNDFLMAVARKAIDEGDRDYGARLIARLPSDKQEGWNGNTGRGRLRLHQARHLLGEPDAFAAARRDFTEDMASSQFGVSTTLWSLDDVLPVLYEVVRWPDLWDRLVPQIEASRDHQLGKPMANLTDVEDDIELIAALIVWAASLGPSALEVQAVEAAVALRDELDGRVFAAVVDRLLADPGDQSRLAAELLCGSAEDSSAKSVFAPKLEALVYHEDIAVSAAACWLGHQWELTVQPRRIDLPAFYSLDLPEASSPSFAAEPVLGDPLSLTATWKHMVDTIADDAGVSPEHVRYRVAQLAGRWNGSKSALTRTAELERVLGWLDLKIRYHRPEATEVLRGLRIVAGELWRAGRIPAQRLRFLLRKLRVDPELPPVPRVGSRPESVQLPPVPRMLFGKEELRWRESVKDDVADREVPANVLAEWSRSTVREIRRSAIVERLMAQGVIEAHGKIDEALDDLPRVIWLRRLIPLYDRNEIHRSHCALFDPNRMNPASISILVFCPGAAEMLGWFPDPDRIGAYRDADGNEMVRTICWAEGVEQPVDQDERSSEGQCVLLSTAGAAAYRARFGDPTFTTRAWRRVENHESGGSVETCAAYSR